MQNPNYNNGNPQQQNPNNYPYGNGMPQGYGNQGNQYPPQNGVPYIQQPTYNGPVGDNPFNRAPYGNQPAYQQPNPYGNQPQQQNPQKQKRAKDKKPKKKKKHVFLWILLSLLVIGFGTWGVMTWQNNAADKYIDNLLSDQPFIFNADDYCDYITEDFTVPNKILDNGKEVSITWESDTPDVISANGNVNSPEQRNKIVKLTASVKHGLGTGEKTYVLTAVKTGVIEQDDVYVVTQEEIDAQKGKNNLTITYADDGSVHSIDGDFSLTPIGNGDDGLVVLDAYADIFNTNGCEYKFAGVASGIDGQQFKYVQTYNDIPVLGRTSIITTDNSGYMDSVAIRAEKNIGISIKDVLSESKIAEKLSSHYGCEVELNNIQQYIADFNGWKQVFKMQVQNTEQNLVKDIIVDAISGELLQERDGLITAVGQMVNSTSTNEYGNKVDIQINKEDGLYRFEDTKRKILIVDGLTWGSLYLDEDENKIFDGDYDRLYEVYYTENREVVSDRNDFSEYPFGVSAYDNFVQTYDWYQNTLGVTSFDGKGMPVVCIMSDYMEDNAAYFPYGKTFYAFDNGSSFRYAPAAELGVIGHEYTHGVFDSLTGGDSVNYINFYEMDSVNEAYADIFGCLIEGNWVLGENISPEGRLLRDITFVSELKTCEDDLTEYMRTYKQEGWIKKNIYGNSVVLSHAAYKMTQQGFSNTDVAKIWYQSLVYAFDENADYLTVRSNVERAAKKLGYSDEQLVTIGQIFTDLGIGSMETIEIDNDAVSGDTMKDDVVEKDFLIICSPIGTLFGSPILIYEEDNSIEQTMTDAEISKLVTDYFMDTIVGDNQLPENELGLQFEIKVEYSRMPSWIMDIVKKYAEDARNGLIDEVATQTGASSEDLNWMNLFFVVQTYHGTSYDFWSECVGIDFSIVDAE